MDLSIAFTATPRIRHYRVVVLCRHIRFARHFAYLPGDPISMHISLYAVILARSNEL